jgi:hypothetical protein
MAEWVSKRKVKLVLVNPFFYFEYDHIPNNDEIKESIQEFIDTKRINYSITVSYDREQKGNFWDAETKQFYSWDELQELAETRKDYKLMENSINGLHNNT